MKTNANDTFFIQSAITRQQKIVHQRLGERFKREASRFKLILIRIAQKFIKLRRIV